MRGKKTAAEGTNLALPPSQIGFAQLFFFKLALPIFDLGHAAHVKDVKLIGERRSKTIRELSERGISVLLVEQSVRLASSFADELHVLDMGRMAKIKDRQGELDEEKLREAYLGGR